MLISALAALALSSTTLPACAIELVVLGVGQDAGAPQIGNPDDPAWRDDSLSLWAASVAVVDHRTQSRYLFEATPFITQQLKLLDEIAPSQTDNLGLTGIFLTHAHMGHYAGLAFLGFEAANTQGVPVYAMPRFSDYLSTNGPWEQLVRYDNIALTPLSENQPVALSEDLSVTPYQVPHRDEYSETVGFLIEARDKKALFIPDIDSWEEWETDFDRSIDTLLGAVDYAFLDATFYNDQELPGRDMSVIPHPRISASMDRFDALPVGHRQAVRFIHLNHTNPARFADSDARAEMLARGYALAARGDRHCLMEGE